MRHITSALLPALPKRSYKELGINGLLALATVTIPGVAAAQSGSVDFAVQSLDEVTTIPDPYSEFFSRLYVHPIGSTSQSPDILYLRNFDSHTQFADPDVEDDKAINTMVAEYIGLVYSDGVLSSISETGMMAFQVKVEEDIDMPTASGDNVVGFVRTTTNPSTYARTKAPGYFDGLSGTMEWDFQRSSRTVLLRGSGANYDPNMFFSSYTLLNTFEDNSARISNLNLPITSAGVNYWNIQSSFRLNSDLTNTDPSYSFWGSFRLPFLPDDEDLPVSPDPETIEPDSFQYSYYLMTVVDQGDSDGDGVPDFLDLTSLSMPLHASSQLGNSAWYYSAMFDDWFYSTANLGNWDYSMKLGWVYDPSTAASFDPERINLWVYTPPANATDFGWLWTGNSVLPSYYRYHDGVWLYSMGLDEGTGTSTFYNFETGSEETLQY